MMMMMMMMMMMILSRVLVAIDGVLIGSGIYRQLRGRNYK
jgi:hypothetical protein